jgi:hypothetical protein
LLQTLQSLIPANAFCSPLGSLQSFSALDAVGEKYAFVFRIPKTGNVHKVHWRTATVTSAQPVRVSLETVNTSGDPSGTNYGGSSPGVEAAPVSNTSYATTLAVDATAVSNDLVAVVLQWDSTAGNLQIAQAGNLFSPSSVYSDNFISSWAKTGSQQPYCALEYSDGSFAWTPFVVFGVPLTATININGTPDELGNRFKLPFPARLSAVFFCGAPSAGRDFDFVLYDAANNVLATKSPLAAAFTGNGRALVPLDSPVDLAKNVVYRLTYRPSVASSNNYYGFTVPSNAALGHHDLGVECYRTQRTDAGAWTDVTTERMWLLPIFDKFDDATLPPLVLLQGGVQLIMAMVGAVQRVMGLTSGAGIGP